MYCCHALHVSIAIMLILALVILDLRLGHHTQLRQSLTAVTLAAAVAAVAAAPRGAVALLRVLACPLDLLLLFHMVIGKSAPHHLLAPQD